MQLLPLDTALDRELEAKVVDVSASRIYFLACGHQTWYSWKRQYEDADAIHTNIATAQAEAEDKRGQGNVFYITERPAISIRTARATYVVVQINTDNPCSVWRAKPRQTVLQRRFNPAHPIGSGTTVGVLLDAFRPDSSHWKQRPLDREIALMAHARVTDAVLERLAGRSLVAYQSKAVGANRYLRWNEVPTSLRPNGVYTAVRVLRRLLDPESVAVLRVS
jgi:hypothetical protein